MTTDNAKHISQAFAAARKTGRALETFPIRQPVSLAEAYFIQDQEIALGDIPEGWKVAAIKPEFREKLGAERLVGPIVRLIDARALSSTPIDVPVIAGGFAAVEAEFAIRIGRDLPLSDRAYSEAELLASVESLHIAAEIAGSPLATLIDLGPTAVIADHGNNAAVVIGNEVQDWRERPLETLTSRTIINGSNVGEGGATRLPHGGPLGSLEYLVTHLAQRGKHLKAGDWVATGATTGVHRVAPGDLAIVEFGSGGQLTLQITAQQEIEFASV
jgi:2-keto-4-pentenoate hydratase